MYKEQQVCIRRRLGMDGGVKQAQDFYSVRVGTQHNRSRYVGNWLYESKVLIRGNHNVKRNLTK